MHKAYNNNKGKVIHGMESGTLQHDMRKECITVSCGFKETSAAIGLAHATTCSVLSDVKRIRLCSCTTAAAALVRLVELFL
jgi:hypothetical protein